MWKFEIGLFRSDLELSQESSIQKQRQQILPSRNSEGEEKDFPKSLPKMSASEQMRAMLDQLMGTSRNGEFIFVIFLPLPGFFFFSFCLPQMAKFSAKSPAQASKTTKNAMRKSVTTFLRSFMATIPASPLLFRLNLSRSELFCWKGLITVSDVQEFCHVTYFLYHS